MPPTHVLDQNDVVHTPWPCDIYPSICILNSVVIVEDAWTAVKPNVQVEVDIGSIIVGLLLVNVILTDVLYLHV